MPDDSRPPPMAEGPGRGKTRRVPAVKQIKLALQGGGAHGALTWGVLDRLLADESLEIQAVSGASAGAVNGAALAHGLASGGRETARETLAQLWRGAANATQFTPFKPALLDRWFSAGGLNFSPAYQLVDVFSRLVCPFDPNIMGLSPLRQLLEDHIDFSRLRETAGIDLFISATDALDGRARIFSRAELTVDALMAATCLPLMQRPVTIDGRPYWDGGYVANPPLHHLAKENSAQCDGPKDSRAIDIVLVQLTPFQFEDLPGHAAGIMDRLTAIAFNAGLLRELQHIEFVNKMVAAGQAGDGYRPIHLHVIHAEDVVANLDATSKLNVDWDFLRELFDIGQARADAWLADNRKKLGRASSFQSDSLYV